MWSVNLILILFLLKCVNYVIGIANYLLQVMLMYNVQRQQINSEDKVVVNVQRPDQLQP